MPIRFRCAYCNQLMGIARRKANTVVNCPKCNGQVVVPTPEEEAGALPPSLGPPPPPPRNLFEDGNISQLLRAPAPPDPVLAQARVEAASTPLPMPAIPNGWSLPNGAELGLPARGVFLTPGMLTLICVLIVLLMGLTFFLGLLLGKSAAG